MKKYILTTLCLICFSAIYSQSVNTNKGYVLPAIIVDGDTLAIVKLNRVYVFPPLKFANHDEYLKYRRLVRDVKKVYPYAMIARKTMIDINLALDTIPEGRKQKQYVKKKEDELMAIYAEELKSLSIRQGRILIKLVDRELNQTSYDLIKELRGTTSAFMWQSLARLFGESLKAEYDPLGEDMMIERIVILIDQGSL